MKRLIPLALALLLAFATALAVPSASITDEAADRYQQIAFAEEE